MKLHINATGIGDILNVTPSIRKLSEVGKRLGKKLSVYSYNTDILKNNIHCEVLPVNDYKRSEDSFEIFVESDNRFMMMKNNNISQLNVGGCNIIDYQSIQCGFTLTPDEKTLDYFPDDSNIFEQYNIPENYIIFNTCISWESRTWKREKWQELINLCNDNNIFTVLVGKENENLGIYENLDVRCGLDLQNETSIDDLWHLLNKAKCLVCTDSGVLHLAGTTDVEILLLSGSINPYHRLPFRNGSQDYKTTIINGECTIFCASNIAYNKLEHGTFMGTPPINECLEKYETFKCHPKTEDVFLKLKSKLEWIDWYEKKDIIPDSPFKDNSNITYRFENYNTDINHDDVKFTKKIWLNIWDVVDDILVRFIDTSYSIPMSSYEISVSSAGEWWFDIHSNFDEYNNFKIEVIKDEIMIYENIFEG